MAVMTPAVPPAAAEPVLVCPVCRYPNRRLQSRCLRCGAALLTPLTCQGACAACLLAPTAGGCPSAGKQG